MTGLVTICVTAPNGALAEGIGRVLVEERLAACANILPGGLAAGVSLYRWQGEIQRDAEAVLLLKTRAALFDAVAARVKALHSYELPCIVAWPIVAASAEYADWVRAQTREA